MKEITSSCEKEFLKKLIKLNKRLDGRELDDSREIKIRFGAERGCCLVSIGNTCVMSQVSCELSTPRMVRPSEGQLHINVEISPMAAPNIEANRSSDLGIEYSRLLERCVRDSRCIDLENLCIVSGEKVWNIRVNVHVLNHDGNIAECSSIAAIAALSHFRRPDVTVLGTEVTMHTPEERDPVPLNMLHLPFATTIAVFDQGDYLVLDPTEFEEKIADGNVTVAMNSHSELCMLHLGGHVSVIKDKILVCTLMASGRTREICDTVKEALAEDSKARAAGLKIGFASILQSGKNLGTRYIPDNNLLQATINESVVPIANPIKTEEPITKLEPVFLQEPGVALLGEGGPSSWDMLDIGESKKIEDSPKIKKKVLTEALIDDASSEEEITIVLGGDVKQDETKKEKQKPSSRTWYQNSW